MRMCANSGARLHLVKPLGFTLEEIREARLAPIVSFKGRGATPAADTDLNNTAAEYGKAGE